MHIWLWALVIEDGFKIPTKRGSYGCGIYFASDSTKSARYARTTALEVPIGKDYRADFA